MSSGCQPCLSLSCNLAFLDPVDLRYFWDRRKGGGLHSRKVSALMFGCGIFHFPPKGGDVIEAGEMGLEGSSVGHSYFKSYIHLLGYIRTNLLPAALFLDTKKKGVGKRVARSLFTQFR